MTRFNPRTGTTHPRCRITTRNLYGTWKKGYLAGWRTSPHVGDPAITNPYTNRRTRAGGATFSRSFSKAWWRGHVAGRNDAEAINKYCSRQNIRPAKFVPEFVPFERI